MRKRSGLWQYYIGVGVVGPECERVVRVRVGGRRQSAVKLWVPVQRGAMAACSDDASLGVDKTRILTLRAGQCDAKVLRTVHM